MVGGCFQMNKLLKRLMLKLKKRLVNTYYGLNAKIEIFLNMSKERLKKLAYERLI
jgi:hypothetical protein